MSVPPTYIKDPDAVLDYSLDWSDWLGNDTISSVAWDVEAGITQDSVSNTTTTATIWLSGGSVDITYTIQCEITTAGGRTDERSFYITVRNK